MKNENNILNNNFCFSKALKDIDFIIKFKNYKEEKSAYILKQLKKEQKEKKMLLSRKKNHNEIVHDLQKANEESELLLNDKTRKYNNMSQINFYSSRNNSLCLPKLSKNEEKKNKDSKIIIFEKIWKEQILNKSKNGRSMKNRKNNSNRIQYNSHYIVNIFDENYDKLKKKKEKNEKNKIIEKIKFNNLKVQKKLKFHQEIMSKFKDKREYSPNYNSIEKHLPDVNLNTKSKRIFPYKFIKKSNVDDLKSQKTRSESMPKGTLRKIITNKSIIFSNISTCTLFKNYLKNNENSLLENKTFSKCNPHSDKDYSFVKGIQNKNRSMIN